MKLNREKTSPRTVLLVLPFLYFAQIYPFIHFHHTHDEHGTKVVLSTHPTEHVDENHSGHHGDDHEHSTPEHVSGERDYTKPSLKRAFILPISFNSISTVVISDNSITTFVVQNIDYYRQPQQVFISPNIPRGPPQLV